MKVIVNGQERGVDLSGAGNLYEALEIVSKNELTPREIITEVTVNETNVSVGSAEEAAKIPFQNVRSLTVISCSSLEMIGRSASECLAFMEELIRSASLLPEMYRMGKTQEANTAYAPFVEGLQQLTTSFAVIKTAVVLFRDDLKLEDPLENQGEGGMLALLKNMLEAQSNRDWIFLADLIEYEMIPLLKGWVDSLGVFLQAFNRPKE